jgi:ubiquinone biosynthesis protein Coq4
MTPSSAGLALTNPEGRWAVLVRASRTVNDLWGAVASSWAADRKAAAAVVERARGSAVGRALLSKHPSVELRREALSQLPAGSFGRFLADWCTAWDVAPGAPHATPRDDEEYVIDQVLVARHAWHALTGLGTDLQNELRFLGVVLAQFRSSSAVMALLLGLVQVASRFGWRAFVRMPGEVWAFYRWGRACTDLCLVDWQQHLTEPVEEVRSRLLARDRPRLGEWQTWPAAGVVLPTRR